MYTFERAANCRELIENRPLWDSLAGDSPFRQASWLSPWWNHFGNDERAFFVVAKNDTGVVCGLLPMYTSGSFGEVLRFVGSGQACSDGLSILCASNDADALGLEMGHWLASIAGQRPDGWHRLDLDGVIAGDQAMISLVQGLTEAGACAHMQSRMHTWFQPTTESFEHYISTLSKSRRRLMRKLSERIDESPELSCHISQTDEELRSDLNAMIELHQRRWNDAGHAGSFADPKFREFIHDSARRFRQDGLLRMATLRHNEQVISGELQMFGGDGAIAGYSMGMDMSFAEIKPGRIMDVETIKYAYQHSLPGIDYLRGDEPYKAELRALPRRLVRLRIASNTTGARLHHAAWKGVFEATQWVRRKRGSEPIVVLPSLRTPSR